MGTTPGSVPPAGRSRVRWWLVGPLVGALGAGAIALVGVQLAQSERAPGPSPSGQAPSVPATARPPMSVQPDLPDLGESQFGDGPVRVEPTEPPASDMGGTVGGPAPGPSRGTS